MVLYLKRKVLDYLDGWKKTCFSDQKYLGHNIVRIWLLDSGWSNG